MLRVFVRKQAFFKVQFHYCPVICVFHSRTLNSKINRLHERSLGITYITMNFKILKNFCTMLILSIHHNNIHALATEMDKVANGMSPEINEVYKQTLPMIM